MRRAGARRLPFCFDADVWLEREARAEFTPGGTGDGGGAGVDESARMTEGVLRGDAVVEVVAVVGAVGEVERLGNELDVVVLLDDDVLCQAHVELEERIAAERVEGGNGAGF